MPRNDPLPAASPERVLVTGGTGLLGCHLLAALCAAGDHVRVLVRRPDARLPRGCEAVHGDVADPRAVRRALGGVRAVYHLAAITRKWLPDRRAFGRVNVDAAVGLARLSAEAGAERIVHVSSFTVFGPSPADGAALEGREPCAPSLLQNDYQRSKHRAHAELAALAARGAAPVVLACPGVLYGPVVPGRNNPVAELVQKQLAGRLARFPGGDRRWTLSWTADVAEGLRLLRRRGAVGGSYVLGGEVASLRDVFAWVAARSGQPAPRRAPLWPFLCAGRALETLALATRRPPRAGAAALRFLLRSWACSSASAQQLGYRMTPLATALHTLWKDLHARRLVPAPPAAVPAA